MNETEQAARFNALVVATAHCQIAIGHLQLSMTGFPTAYPELEVDHFVSEIAQASLPVEECLKKFQALARNLELQRRG